MKALIAVVACGALVALGAVPAGAAAPKSGQYAGSRHDEVLVVSGRSIALAAFSFRCGREAARTSLNSVRIRKRDGVYRFSVRTNASVSFPTGNRPDENAAIRFRGRFSRSGTRAHGVFRVTSRHCNTGKVRWSARR